MIPQYDQIELRKKVKTKTKDHHSMKGDANETIVSSDEPEPEFSSSSRAMKVPSRAELGHFHIRAKTELEFF